MLAGMPNLLCFLNNIIITNIIITNIIITNIIAPRFLTNNIVTTVCRLLCGNVQGLAGNLSDLTVASSRYEILLCSGTMVSDMRHVSELLVPGFGRPILLCQGTTRNINLLLGI